MLSRYPPPKGQPFYWEASFSKSEINQKQGLMKVSICMKARILMSGNSPPKWDVGVLLGVQVRRLLEAAGDDGA